MDGREIAIAADSSSLDSAPLLENTSNASSPSHLVARTRGLSRFFRLLRRPGSRRIMREPSALVRESAAEHLEERQSDWANSRPVVILDLLWNLAFVIVAVVVLIMSREERPSNPLRVWVAVYAAQCCLHMICVSVEYRRRSRHRAHGIRQSSNVTAFSNSPSQRSHIQGESEQMYGEPTLQHTSFVKRIESANTSFSFVWWVIGFYWTTTGSEPHDAPLLFWLCVIFLAFDAFFAIFCVSLACIIGIAVCCCLPCIIALMYALAEQEGASEEDITALPKFRFHRTGSFSKSGRDLSGPFGGAMSMIAPSGVPIERALSAEDAECCICLSSYEEGVELRELPCSHHFHCACIDRWLRMNSTCPLCKYNVSKDNDTGREDV